MKFYWQMRIPQYWLSHTWYTVVSTLLRSLDFQCIITHSKM